MIPITSWSLHCKEATTFSFFLKLKQYKNSSIHKSMESAQQQENQRIPLLFEPDKELNARKEKSYLDCLKKTKTQRKCCKDQLIIQSISIMKSIGFKRKAKNGNKFFTKTEIFKKNYLFGVNIWESFFFLSNSRILCLKKL